MHHRSARTRRADDEIGRALFEQFDKAPGDQRGFIAITGIERRLAATSLPFIKFNFATSAAQNFDRAGADAAPHLIDYTGYEQANLNRGLRILDCRWLIAFVHRCLPTTTCLARMPKST